MITQWIKEGTQRFESFFNTLVNNVKPDKQQKKKRVKAAPVKKASHVSYENRTKEELYLLAQEKNIDGRSTMNKTELIKALRTAV